MTKRDPFTPIVRSLAAVPELVPDLTVEVKLTPSQVETLLLVYLNDRYPTHDFSRVEFKIDTEYQHRDPHHVFGGVIVT